MPREASSRRNPTRQGGGIYFDGAKHAWYSDAEGVVDMLAELDIVPIGTRSTSLSPLLAEVARRIDRSGLAYRVGPMGTVVEGEWDHIMELAKSCHQAMLGVADRVMTTIRLDDRTDKAGRRMEQKVQSLEAKVGKPLAR